MRDQANIEEVKRIADEVKRIVSEKDYEALTRRAEEWGRELSEKNLSMAQIRRIFGEVRRLDMRWDPKRLRMLSPRLAYAAARAGQGGEYLRNILDPAIGAVFEAKDGEEQERFRVLSDLFEAVLAYFTYHKEHKSKEGR